MISPTLQDVAGAAVLPPPLAAGSTYLLTGLTRGSALPRFPRTEALIVENLTVINRAAVALNIYLPLPCAVDVLRKKLTTHGQFFAGQHGDRLPLKRLGLVLVLRYKYADATALKLADAALAASGERGPIDVHLFSEPAAGAVRGLPSNHPQQIFDEYSRILPGLDLQLTDVPWQPAAKYNECTRWERAQLTFATSFVAQHQNPVLVPLIIENA